MTDIDQTALPSVEMLQRLLELGAVSTPIRDHPSGDQVMIVPQALRLETLTDPDKSPRVTRRKPLFTETSSFIDYVTTFKVAEQTRIFVNPDKLQAVAVIDYDAPGRADRGVHRATLQLQHSPEWQTWRCVASATRVRGLAQEEFAEFLEENGVNIIAPVAADLMELVTTMQVTRQVNYKRAINLADGRQQFTYVNDGDTGAVEFPSRLVLGIPVFKGGEHYRVEIILRYRLQEGGSLRFAMIVHRADEILRTALMGNGADIQGDIVAIQEKTGVPVHIGTVD